MCGCCGELLDAVDVELAKWLGPTHKARLGVAALRKEWAMTTYLDAAVGKITGFEGCVPWMYLDTRGNVTVGVGLMLPNAAAAQKLGFVIAGRDATPGIIVARFDAVSEMVKGLVASAYHDVLQLPASAVQTALRGTVADRDAALHGHIAGYDGLPASVKVALLDMAYNLGVEGLLSGYPKMLAALGAKQWARAAAQCERHGIDAQRNAWTSQMLASAVEVR